MLTYSLNLRLCIFNFTWNEPVIGLLPPDPRGLGPGDKGLRQLGDGWLMGDNSALGGFSIPISVVVLKPTAAKEEHLHIYRITENEGIR